MRNFLVAFGALVSAGLFLQCTSIPDVCFDDGCGTSDDGGNDAQIDECIADPTATDCLDDGKALFVSSVRGNDGNEGNKSSSYLTLGAALDAIANGKTNKKRVYVCGAGPYKENVSLGAKHNSVALYGGVDCDWTQSAAKAQFGTLTVVGAKKVVVAEMAFTGLDNTNETGKSSIAAFVNGGDVTFSKVLLTAGNGGKGQDGKPGSSYSTAQANSGNHAIGTTGGQPPNCICDDNNMSNTATGGEGGHGGVSDDTGKGSPGIPQICTLDGSNGTTCKMYHGIFVDGAGGEVTLTANDCSKATGHNGAFGLSGNDGSPGDPSSNVGTVTATFGSILADSTLADNSWQPKLSQAGEPGGVGQGGGGGGGYNYSGGDYTNTGGGGGGCGGCGGAGGGQAEAGGASIALLSYSGTITLTDCILTVGKAGNGGKGAAGQIGQGGGDGAGDPSGKGNMSCSGGNGGNGGNGGASAGGAGGVAAAILYFGDKPNADDPNNKLTSPDWLATANGGNGGNPGVNNGFDGVSGPILEWVGSP